MPLLRCVACSELLESEALEPRCPRCRSALLLEGPRVEISRAEIERLPPGVWRYGAFLPELAAGWTVSLGEGGTPLLKAERLGRELGLDHVLLKDETRNPTGSFIDRGSTVLVSLAGQKGVKAISCTTTGNLGASLAAYCAKAGIEAEVRIQLHADRGKLYQMIAYGARVEAKSMTEVEYDRRTLQVTAGNPYILEGEKTTGFEIIQDLGWQTPDVLVVPVGTGGHISMIWRAIKQLKECGLVANSACRLAGVQVRGSAPTPWRRGGSEEAAKVPFTELEESEPIFRSAADEAIRESGGSGIETTAREIIRATGLLAKTEGIFAEPASASVIAALESARSHGLIDRDETVVCVVTGAGLKDTRAVARIARASKHVAVKEDIFTPVQVGRTKLHLMDLILAKPRFGYELWQSLKQERAMTTASVYQHLAELEGLALVRRSGIRTVNGRERVFYELTKKGSDFLRLAGRIGA
ncbi:MAG: pyridoxal-phosphate dependent enzyme [Nitrososphaerales archaeon]|nr:pyridoxal-phosphate dependent enzyme [Nitrososphaerales archaeon]